MPCSHGRQRTAGARIPAAAASASTGGNAAVQGVRGSHVTILEATEVLLEFEMEEEPDEGLNTVQAHTSWLLVRRGGKRKHKA